MQWPRLWLLAWLGSCTLGLPVATPILYRYSAVNHISFHLSVVKLAAALRQQTYCAIRRIFQYAKQAKEIWFFFYFYLFSLYYGVYFLVFPAVSVELCR